MKKTPGKAGRPEFEPTQTQRSMVQAMTAYGIPDYEIAKVIGISHPTLRKHFWEELETGHIKANANVAKNLYSIATSKEHPKAAICAMFWLKCRAGWRELQDAEPHRPGKKEEAEAHSRTADQGTEWDGLLQPGGPMQ